MTTPSALPGVNAEKLTRLVEISRVLNSATNLQKLLTTIINEAATLINVEAASILLYDTRSRQLFFMAASNDVTVDLARTPVPIDNSIAGAVLQANRPMIISDVSQDPRWNQNVDQAINFQTHNILGVPLRNVKRRPVGVLEAINKQDAPTFSSEDIEMLSILADIAGVAVEKARLIEELRRANKELSELDQIKSDFIAIASHELRTPLAVILGYVSFLREEATPDTKEQMDSVLDAAVHLRTLIQDMVNLRYVDTGEDRRDLDRYDLVTLIRDMRLDQDETAVVKQQTIHLDLPPYPLPIIADRPMIEMVITNLLNNAVKFTGEHGRIHITLTRHQQEARLTISDNGIGIARDDIDRIFKRFYQVESPLRRRYEGMGLGLALVKDIIDLHNGRVWVESKPDSGSRFTIALPLDF